MRGVALIVKVLEVHARMPATREQEELIACLARRNARLAKIYKSGLLVMFDEDNPSRFELAAHCMRVISAMLPAMRFRYKRAINALQAGETGVSDSERSLGNHLTLYYAWGAIEDDDDLLTLFFQKASPALKSQIIGDIGWQLGQEAEKLDPKIQRRLMDFWEHRLALGMVRVNESRRELEGFGWWFACKKFPDDWSVKQVVTVLDTFRAINPDFAVIERLGEMAGAYPFEAVHCLGIIFEEDREGWAIHGWGDNPQIIIREALKGDSSSREEGERVVNLLVARSHRGFRQLLKQEI